MNGLDPVAREAFRGVLQQLASVGASILISSHQLAELDRIVDHIVLMHEGRLLKQGPLVRIREELGLRGGLLVEGTWTEVAIKRHFDNTPNTAAAIDYEQVGSNCVVNIAAPSNGWGAGERETLLTSMVEAGMTPTAFTTKRIDLVDILSAATGLRPEDVGMGISADIVRGEEE
jgi:ABC-type multidrug transport system ATPase subunit